MTIYSLKPGFQALLRPGVRCLAKSGVTANQVTIVAALFSIMIGALIVANPAARWLFILIAVWFPLRMVLNAVDGMLANEFGQKSRLGAYLNEISDVVSDTALYLPFAFVMPFGPFWVGLVIFLAFLSEFVGVLAHGVGAERRYDGPMGKSDRALIFGALGLWVALSTALPGWLFWLLPGLSALLILTTINRLRGGLGAGPDTNQR